MASKNISFDQIPSSIRKPDRYFELNTKLAVRTLPNNKQRMLIIGQKTSQGTVSALFPVSVFSDREAAEYFGYGSIAHLMAVSAIKANPYLDLTICALNDAPTSVSATGSITISGNATSSGTLVVYIANNRIEIGIVSGNTANSIASSLNAELAKRPELPVVASVSNAVVTLTAKNKGTLGNQIGISADVTASGVTVAVAQMSGGAVDPNIADALSVVFAEHYHIIATPYNNQTALEALRAHLDNVSGPMEQRGAVGVYAMNGSISQAVTLSNAINHGRILCAYLRGTRSIPYEIASAMAAVMAFEEDPARPLNTLELKGIHAPNVSNRLSRTEQEVLLYNGVTPLEVGPGEKVQIVRAISTYIKNAQGVDDISLLDITTIRTLDYVRKACRERISLRFPREKLSSKTPQKVKTELLDVLYKLQELEIVEEVDANKDALIVERDLQDPNRLNAKIPVDVVNGLHIFAGRIDLLL